MTRKLVALTLALTLLLVPSALAVSFDASNGYPVVSEPAAFDILARQYTFHVDWSEMDLWKDYEAMTGVHINWILVPTESFNEKRNLMMAANELPDAIMVAGMSNEQLVQYGEDGMLMDLSGLLQNMPALSAAMEEYPQVKAGITMPNGAIYGLPGIFDSGFDSLILGNRLYIQSGYLKNLGMEKPATVDELTAFFQAVADKDADGDGDPNNEIPLGAALVTGGDALRTVAHQLCGSYGLGTLGLVKHPYLQLNADDTLSYLPALDAYKELLQQMNAWYAAGFFNPEILTQDAAENYAGLAENKYAVVVTLSASNFTTETDRYEGVGVLAGPHGDKLVVATNVTLANVGTFVITADCKQPELMASWIDWFYSEPGIIKFFMGTEGKTFDIVNGEYVYQDWITHDPSGRSMDELIGTFSAYPGGGAPRVVKEKYFSGTQKQPDAVASAKLYMDFLCPTVAASFTYTLEESERLINLSDLHTYANNMMIKLITGAESFDVWDTYLAELEKLNVEEYLRIESEAYARYVNAL